MIATAQVVTLAKGHDLESFSCGVENLDHWLHKASRPTGGEGSNRTYIWVAQDDTILGFFTLTPAVVVENPMTNREAPAILLAKFAVCIEGQGKKPSWGAQLMGHAFEVAVSAADLIGGKYLAVDPASERATKLYSKFGFEAVEDGGTRMLVKMSAVRKALAQTGSS